MALFGRRESKEEKEKRKRQEQLEKELEHEDKIKNSKSALKNIEGAREHLEDDEEIIDYLYGTYESKRFGQDSLRNGVLIATDNRIIFYGKKMMGYDLETIDYHRISSIDYNKGPLSGNLKIYTSGNDIEFSTSMEHNARDLMRLIKEKQNAPKEETTTIVNSPGKSPAEEIKEYKELLDMEIITQKEFDAKKKELLDL